MTSVGWPAPLAFQSHTTPHILTAHSSDVGDCRVAHLRVVLVVRSEKAWYLDMRFEFLLRVRVNSEVREQHHKRPADGSMTLLFPRLPDIFSLSERVLAPTALLSPEG
jgi:hypothetical protein